MSDVMSAYNCDQPMLLMESESWREILSEKKKGGQALLAFCGNLPDICGKGKLQRKIKSELNFLMKIRPDTRNLQENHLKSSNLPHLSAIVECISRCDGVIKLLMPATYNEATSPDILKQIIVDIVADYGRTWIKVVARNPDALLQLSRGNGKFGRKSLIDQVKELRDCALQNECFFSPPKIKVSIVGNICEELLKPLEEMNVEVVCLNQKTYSFKNSEMPGDSKSQNQISHPCDSNPVCESAEEQLNSNNPSSSVREMQSLSQFPHFVPKIKELDFSCDFPLSAITNDAILNLDVSCMLAAVSNLTNGYCSASLRDKMLADQARSEARSPVRYYLDKLFPGHKLMCCNSAYARFVDIFTVIGGRQEKKRAYDLLSRVIIVPDNPSSRSMQLQEVGQISKKSKIIFGTGDTLKAVTVTANAGFIRAAKCQGEKFVAFLHESRALSEMKEIPCSC